MSEQTRAQRYYAYIDSDHWKELRQKKLSEHGRFCAICDSRMVLHVHHIRYRDYVDCTTADLAVLCERCHDDLHTAARALRVDYIGMEVEQISAFLAQAKSQPKFIKKKESKAARRERRRKARSDQRKAAAVTHASEPVRKPKTPKTKVRRKQIRAEYRKVIHDGYSNRSLKEFAGFLSVLSDGPDVDKIEIEEIKYKPEEVTPELIESLKTNQKGWNRKVLASIGIDWPPKSGWKREILKKYAETAKQQQAA